MVKVPYEKAYAEVVQYDNSDVIQTASNCNDFVNRIGHWWCDNWTNQYLGGSDKPIIGG